MEHLVAEILDLPNKVSLMTLKQKQLTDLVMVRSVYDPLKAAHIGLDNARKTGEIHVLPRVLKLSNVTFLGFLSSKVELTTNDKNLLLSKLVEEDEHLDWEELGGSPEKFAIIKDYYDYCLDTYLKDNYVSPRYFKGEPYKTFKKGGTLKPFLFTEAPYNKDRAVLDFDIVPKKAVVINDLSIDADFLLENKIFKYSELTEQQKYAVQFFCELRLIDPKTQRLSGDLTHVILYPTASRLKAAGYDTKSTPAKLRRVEIDQVIDWYPESNEPQLGEIPYVNKDLLKHAKFSSEDKPSSRDITPLIIFEIVKLYLDIKAGKELEKYQEAIRYQASTRKRELESILKHEHLQFIPDAFSTIYRQNLKSPVTGTQIPRGLTKTFLAEYIYEARHYLYLISTEDL